MPQDPPTTLPPPAVLLTITMETHAKKGKKNSSSLTLILEEEPDGEKDDVPDLIRKVRAGALRTPRDSSCLERRA